MIKTILKSGAFKVLENKTLYIIVGGRTGYHALLKKCTSMARLISHFIGYIQNNMLELRFNVFAGSMFCGVLFVKNGVHTFYNRSGKKLTGQKVATYKNLNLVKA